MDKGSEDKAAGETQVSHTLVPTSGVSFEDQTRIVRAYVVLSDAGAVPVHYREVVEITQLARTQVSGVNSFMVMLGLLERCEKGTYKPTKDAIRLSDCEPGKEDFSLVRDMVDSSPLGKLVFKFMKVHGDGMSEELVGYIMGKAGTDEQFRVETALEWLIRSGVVERTE